MKEDPKIKQNGYIITNMNVISSRIMKIMKSYYQWILPIAIPLLAVSVLFLYFPTVAAQWFKIHWLALAATLIMAVGPWGKLRLAAHEAEPPRFSRWNALLQIIGLQLCMTAVFLGISTLCGQTMPIFTTPQPALFERTLSELLVAQGLFPWAFIALLAVKFGYWSYRRGEDAYLATTMDSRLRGNDKLTGVAINFIGRLNTFFAYALTFCLTSLLWAGLAAPVITGFYVTPILVSVILLLLSLTKIYRRNVLKSLGKNIPLIPGLFLWVVFFAVAIWLLNGLLAPVTQISISAPSLLNHWLNQPWYFLWLIFANSWWLLWLPLLSITVARISRGYRIRELIAATLGLPLLAGIGLALTSARHWDISPHVAAVLAGLGLFGLLSLTLHQKAVPAFILTYLPRQDHYKFRSYRSTVIKTLKAAAGFLFIFLPGGVLVAQFPLFAATLPLVFISLRCRRD
jgi:choline-glycine betaine transporter